MARHIEAVCRLCRREGEKLFLKGSRCLSAKCAIERRQFHPGQHGPNVRARRNKASDFSVQLREKQKMRRIYGVLEKQFRRYFGMALKTRGVTGAELLVLLERRLDNVVYRMGFAASRAAARQLVAHAHLDINGYPIDVASYLVKPGDRITVREVSRKLPYFKTLAGDKDVPTVPGWLHSDRSTLTGVVNALPKREDINVPLKEQLVVEYYSR
jgi:small subunit ribosomal protein S4